MKNRLFARKCCIINAMKKDTYIAIGLMSGTSLDGVDAVAVRTDGEQIISVLEKHFVPYQAQFSQKIQQLATKDVPLNDVLRLEREVTDYHLNAVNELLAKTKEEVDVVGFHGQTIRHLPDEGLTWQIGDSNYLSAKLNIPVVGDFRRRDMANEGQGAPLVPLFHQALFANQSKPCAVVNIGGVSNMTYLDKNSDIKAGDCGPGMGLLDTFMQENSNQLFDKKGEVSLAGDVDNNVLKKSLLLPFFDKKFPKSADRYDFDAISVEGLGLEDGAATLMAITAEGILSCLPDKNATVWLTGGGSKNKALAEYLQQQGVTVKPVEDMGWCSDSLEAACFAWLAVRRLHNKPFSTPETTGCNKPSCGGVLTV
jgi:anhydro-N-acetylmuramic acid kinase